MPASLSSLLLPMLAALIAATLSRGLIGLARRSLRKGFQDAANERSLHDGVIPKVGGLGLFGAVFLVMVTMLCLQSANGRAVGAGPWLWLGCASFIFALCVINDRSSRELSPLLRLAGYSLAAIVLCLAGFATGPLPQGIGSLFATTAMSGPLPSSSPWAWAALAACSVIAFTNLFNFMDGMDGLAGSMGLIGFASLALAALAPGAASLPQPGLISLVIAAACAGFLLWNWPRAKVFMGDTGSTFLGFSAAALGWQGWQASLWHWSLPFIAFFPCWFDASLTLLRRLLRGEAIWRAHREHFYQRAVLSLGQAPDAHLRVLRPALVLMLCSAAAALWVQAGAEDSAARALPAALLLLVLHGAVALFIEHRLRQARARDAAPARGTRPPPAS